MSKAARNRIEELERRQWEAEWSRVLDEFPRLSEYALGNALAFWRKYCGFPPASLNPETLNRVAGARPDLLKVIHAIAPDIPACALRYAVQVHLAMDSATVDELRQIRDTRELPARMAAILDPAAAEYEKARKATIGQ